MKNRSRRAMRLGWLELLTDEAKRQLSLLLVALRPSRLDCVKRICESNGLLIKLAWKLLGGFLRQIAFCSQGLLSCESGKNRIKNRTQSKAVKLTQPQDSFPCSVVAVVVFRIVRTRLKVNLKTLPWTARYSDIPWRHVSRVTQEVNADIRFRRISHRRFQSVHPLLLPSMHASHRIGLVDRTRSRSRCLHRTAKLASYCLLDCGKCMNRSDSLQ